MKKMLKKETLEVYYFDEKGNKIIGIHDKLRGDVSGLSGDVSRLGGDVTGISGDVTGIIGTIDECEITDEERERGININNLIKL